jgi:hypothetical protein
MKKTIKKRDLNARGEHDAGDDHGDKEQEPVHHTRGRGVLQHSTYTPVIPVLGIRNPGSGAFLNPLDPRWVKYQNLDPG